MDDKELRIWQTRAEILFQMYETGETEQQTQKTERALDAFLERADGTRQYLLKNSQITDAVPVPPEIDRTVGSPEGKNSVSASESKYPGRIRPVFFTGTASEEEWVCQEEPEHAAQQEQELPASYDGGDEQDGAVLPENEEPSWIGEQVNETEIVEEQETRKEPKKPKNKRLPVLLLLLLLVVGLIVCLVIRSQKEDEKRKTEQETHVADTVDVTTTAPTKQPTEAPTKQPTEAPTKKPTEAPTKQPTKAPTKKPTEAPTKQPTAAPTKKPTAEPTAKPTAAPTAAPTAKPTAVPTAKPTAAPTAKPTAEPTAVPTKKPAPMPTPITLESLRQDYKIGERRAASMARNQKISVYTGPGTRYIRGANGKAMVSTNDWVDCYGIYGDWYLIEYETNSSKNRRGFINRHDIRSKDTMNDTPLSYADIDATVKQKTTLTDDPKKSQNVLLTVQKGQRVTIHFFDDSWACVSLQSGSNLVQGYVKASVLELDPSVNDWLPVSDASMQQPQIEEKMLTVSGVYASSYISGSKVKWVPDYLIDGENDTSWQFRTTSVAKISDIYLDFELESPSAITELWIRNGFIKATSGYDQYWRNGRLAQVEVSFRTTGSAAFEESVLLSIADERSEEKSWTKLSLGMHRQVEAVRVRVKKIYAGSKFTEDVAVSEMRIVGEEETDLIQRMAEMAESAESDRNAQQVFMGTLIKNEVNLRKKPAQSGSSLGRYSRGETFEVLGKRLTGDTVWYKVMIGNKTGYFRSDMVEVENAQMLPQL